MAQHGEIDLWFSCGSPYSYLTMMRLDDVEASLGVRFRLRPFYLAQLCEGQGNWPFKPESARAAYMWRDIGRRAAALGLAPSLPAPYPAAGAAVANQIAWLGLQQNWGRAFLRTSFRAWFEDGLSPGSPENYGPALRALGRDPDRILKIIERAGVHASLVAETSRARALGVFGAPSFTVDGEIFWGDDRLEDALDRIRQGA